MGKEDFAFRKMNYILLAVGMAVVILGFILMSGAGSEEGVFNAEIFSARRIKLAPLVSLLGFLFIVVAILWRRNSKNEAKV
ncbi:MAG: DUF3098 domain-containing protein [Bacteroidaceae bacterium]|nr:DUF3098 domain-containing protein [Bacteroidaceae bacterium]MBQ2595736.1 DUF3098 domain-containing protein [Bacteroidaceae bacterium]MBQ3958500.1 DUF3098 domain-containing protein [Bacteroidaceae bacterium]MBQ3992344.1 DUF3098 domain-containing protein [Bacteroidaceae bacterium]MBQ4002859.1 DUF3098 domain-containing protein [Bacteroidaceae bacterium]